MSPISIIIFQVILLWALVFFVFFKIKKKEKKAPADDIGLVWLFVLTIYTTIPVISWLVQGGQILSPFIARLFEFQPTEKEIIYLNNIAICYAAPFTICYLFLRMKAHSSFFPDANIISTRKIIAALIIAASTKIVLFFLTVFSGLGNSESYIDQYRVILEAPLVIRQALKVLISISSIAYIVLLIAILQRWPKFRWWFYLMILMLFFSFDPQGGRAGFAASLLTIIIGWHILVRPIKTKLLVVGSFLAFILFLVSGLYRSYGSLSSVSVTSDENPGFGEFDAIWANSIELLREKETGNLNTPTSARFGEFFEYIPSQILPFEKKSLSNWYVETYYSEYKDQGGGWAFGAVSQAVIGGGMPEALLRGALLGISYGLFFIWFRSKQRCWWRLTLYLYLIVYAFMSIRDTTFQQLGVIVQTILPTFLLIALLAGFIKSMEKT